MSWRRVRLKALLSEPVQNGYSPVCPEKPNGKWVLGLGALSDFGLDTTQIKPAPIDDSKVDNFLLRPGDFLVSRSNTRDKVGRSALFKGEIKNCSYPDLMMRFRVNETAIYPEFLEMYLRSHEAVKYFQRSASGTSGSMVKINKRVVESLQVPLPPLPEQLAIADLLSTWDAAIEKTEKLIAAKEKRFLWLQNYLISHHSTSTGYKMLRLKDILTESRMPDLEGDPEKRITVRLHLKGVAAREYRGTEADGATTFYKRRAGQFIYGKQNIFKGSLGIIPSELDGFSSTQDIPAFDINDTLVSIDWFYFYISRPPFYKRLEVYAAGSGSKRLHPKELLRLPIKLPPLSTQNEIAEEIAYYKKEIDLLRTILEAYRKQKRGLMQKLLTGQWRIAQASCHSCESGNDSGLCTDNSG